MALFGFLQAGILPYDVGGGAETFHILAETGDNLAAENSDLLTQE